MIAVDATVAAAAVVAGISGVILVYLCLEALVLHVYRGRL